MARTAPAAPYRPPREIRFYLEDAGARLIVAMPGEHVRAAAGATGAQVVSIGPEGLSTYVHGADATEPVEEILERAGDDTAVLLYTSGTTGRPKGAELTFDNLQSNLRAWGRCMEPCSPRPGRRGASKPDLSSLRTAVCGGVSLPLEVMRRFEETFGCTILEGYGLSETSPVASFNHPDRERKGGSIGGPDPRRGDEARRPRDRAGPGCLGHGGDRRGGRAPRLTRAS